MPVSADDIARLLASAPPRKVSAQVLMAARRGRGHGSVPLVGLLCGLFSVPFLWIFFPWTIRNEWRLAADGITVAGEISRVAETSMSLNDVKVMEYVFTFPVSGGGVQTARCYTTGRQWDQGDGVTVRYLPASPEIACIEGARLSQGGLFGVMVAILPLAGLGLVAWWFYQRVQTARLLREGRMAEVDVFSVEATNMQVNRQTVFKIELSAPHLPAGQRLTIRRVNQRDIELAGRHLGQKQPVFVLYDPRKPARMIFPEALLDR